MRLLRLEVRDFGCVRAAELDLAPGLNVLYGPNDLGKSSLVTALRAVLLLPSSSSAHKDWVSWHGDEAPRVELTFQTDERRFWKVSKSFGTGAKGTALLESSRDGESFAVESKGRQVDGELREILAWGIPGPGGKGAPRGLPESFLAAALLGRQEGTGEIFARNLAADPDASGKERLMSALEKLGEDPLLKKIQKEAQDKVDEAFTSKGAKKSGKNAPFPRLREQIRQAAERVTELNEQVRAGELVRERLDVLRERHWTIEAKAVESRKRWESARDHGARARERRELEARRDRTAREIRRIDALSTAITEGEEQEAELDERLRRYDTESISASKARLEAERIAERAGEKLRRLRDGEAEAKRRLRRGELETRRLEIDKIEDRHRRLSELSDALGEAEEARDHAADLRRRAEELRAGTEGSTESGEDLPSEETLAALRKLREDKKVLEARLDVGLSLDVHPLRELKVEFSRDGEAPQQANLSLRTTLEGKGQVKLSIEGVADLRVRGGTQDIREQLDEIDARWRRQVLPHLERTGTGTLEELEATCRAAEKKRRETEQARRDAEGLDEGAARAQASAEKIEPLRERIAELRDALGEEGAPERLAELTHEREALRAELAELGEGDSPNLKIAEEELARARQMLDRAKERETGVRRERDAARQALERLRGELDVRREQSTDLDHDTRETLTRELEAAEASLAESREPSGEPEIDVDAVRQRFEQTREALQKSDAEIRGEEGALRQVGGEPAKEKLRLAEEALRRLREQETELERDYGAWRLLLQTVRDAEHEQSSHLGQALIGPVSERFHELTRGRYGRLRLGPNLETLGIEASGDRRAVGALSVGTRDQLGTILRLTLARQLGSTVVLDDQLVQSDAGRLEWFRDLLLEQAREHQAIIITCRPEEYLRPEELSGGDLAWRDHEDGRLRVIDLERIIERH